MEVVSTYSGISYYLRIEMLPMIFFWIFSILYWIIPKKDNFKKVRKILLIILFAITIVLFIYNVMIEFNKNYYHDMTEIFYSFLNVFYLFCYYSSIAIIVDSLLYVNRKEKALKNKTNGLVRIIILFGITLFLYFIVLDINSDYLIFLLFCLSWGSICYLITYKIQLLINRRKK